MERSELERELERLHAESWGWALAGGRQGISQHTVQDPTQTFLDCGS